MFLVIYINNFFIVNVATPFIINRSWKAPLGRFDKVMIYHVHARLLSAISKANVPDIVFNLKGFYFHVVETKTNNISLFQSLEPVRLRYFQTKLNVVSVQRGKGVWITSYILGPKISFQLVWGNKELNLRTVINRKIFDRDPNRLTLITVAILDSCLKNECMKLGSLWISNEALLVNFRSWCARSNKKIFKMWKKDCAREHHGLIHVYSQLRNLNLQKKWLNQ